MNCSVRPARLSIGISMPTRGRIARGRKRFPGNCARYSNRAQSEAGGRTEPGEMIASSAKQNQKGQTAALMLTEVAEVLADAEERRRSRGACSYTVTTASAVTKKTSVR